MNVYKYKFIFVSVTHIFSVTTLYYFITYNFTYECIFISTHTCLFICQFYYINKNINESEISKDSTTVSWS